VIRESAIRELNGRYRGRARDLAYLELVQEHFLHWMLVDGLFESCVFKGGTALRKFVFGLSGRFSTDLDFGSRDDGPGAYVLLMLRNGLVHEGVKFVVESDDEQDDGRHLRWRGETEEFGSTIVAKMDFTTYGSLMPAVMRARAALPGVDVRLGFEPVQVPLMDLRENAAEKLARMRRHVVARDLFDLDASLRSFGRTCRSFGSYFVSRCTSTLSIRVGAAHRFAAASNSLTCRQAVYPMQMISVS
jgi:predicted nucleotidyltransferase component of viral defense system